jgi:hypothetical protein
MLTVDEALRAYAVMMNTLDASKLLPLLADDFYYTSQFVFSEIESKREYAKYITSKLSSVKAAGSRVWVEMAWLEREFPGPCVLLAQGEPDDLGVVLAQVEGNTIKRFDLCSAPSPHSARRTGEYPGRS